MSESRSAVLESPVGPAPPRRHTILVVDDEPEIVRSMRELLRLDYRVLTTTSAEEAMRLLEREEVHVVMTDQRMPGMTGVEFLRHIKGDHPDAIRLLVTGYADIHAVIEAINQGNVFRYITKPWDPDELLSIIREAVERYNLIVERKRLTADLQNKNRQLEAVNHELSDANRMKEAFIQVASHELRTPIAIMEGLLNLIERDPAHINTDLLVRLHKTSGRLHRLVEQLTTMLALGRYTISAQRTVTEVAPLLRQAVEDVQPFIALRRQQFKCEVPDELGQAQLDPMQIRSVLNHLLLNAIKFTPDNGTVTLSASGTTEAVVITIADTGVGIAPEEQARLFQPFFTGFDVSRHSSGQYEYNRKGLGLGLSVVKGFIEMHGGTIAVNSAPGAGTRIDILLPRSPPPEIAGEPGQLSAATPPA